MRSERDAYEALADAARRTGCHEPEEVRPDYSAAEGIALAVGLGGVIYGLAILLWPIFKGFIL